MDFLSRSPVAADRGRNRAVTCWQSLRIFALAVGVLAATASLATSVVPMSWHALQARASWVGLVEIDRADAELIEAGADGGERLVTFYRANVLSVLGGKPDDDERQIARFALPGGTLDGITAKVIGSPLLRAGDMVVVFFNRARGPHRARGTVSFSQGVLVVDPRTGLLSNALGVVGGFQVVVEALRMQPDDDVTMPQRRLP